MNPMLANIVLEFFLKGGPVMWPILISAIVAVAVVGERAFWWLRESRRRDPQKLEQLLAALENSDLAAARKISEGSDDPVIRMIHHGLGHVGHKHSSLLGALQLAAGVELKSFFSEAGVLVPIAKSEASYLRPLFPGDKLTVSCAPAALSDHSYEIRFEITRLGPPDKVAGRVRTEHVCIGSKSRERQALPAELAAWVKAG